MPAAHSQLIVTYGWVDYCPRFPPIPDTDMGSLSRLHRSGLSLLDVVISVLIIGVLAASAGPRFAGTLEFYRAQSAAERIQADLGLARESARSNSSPVAVQFSPATDDYTIPAISHLDSPGLTYAVDIDAAYDAEIVSAVLGGDSVLTFDRYGQPDSGGTVTVQSGGTQQTVTVDSDTGRGSIP